MACPYFMPAEKWEGGGTWIHPSRLPLGAGWRGRCCAPGHEGVEPCDHELRDHCNLGYAVSCSRIPKERLCDAVRFSVARDTGQKIELRFAFELAHCPAGDGMLAYDGSRAQWTSSHADPRVQKMAECYLQSYLLRRIQPAVMKSRKSANP